MPLCPSHDLEGRFRSEGIRYYPKHGQIGHALLSEKSPCPIFFIHVDVQYRLITRACISYYKGTIRYNDICPKKICFLIVALGQPEKKINLFYRIILGHWLTGM